MSSRLDNPTRYITDLLRSHRYRLGNEALLQEDVESVLTREHIIFQREHRLGPADRVDFLIDGKFALELKIKAPKRRILRQLERYALHDCVQALFLMTVTPIGLPARLADKPVHVIQLGRTFL